MPGGICTPAFSSLFTAFIVGILVDIGFQVKLPRYFSFLMLAETKEQHTVLYVLLELEVLQTLGALSRLQRTGRPRYVEWSIHISFNNLVLF